MLPNFCDATQNRIVNFTKYTTLYNFYLHLKIFFSKIHIFKDIQLSQNISDTLYIVDRLQWGRKGGLF